MGGVSSARNIGLKYIQDCDWIAFVDADDYLNKDYISSMLGYNADVIVSGSQWLNEKYEKIKIDIPKREKKTIEEIKQEYYELGGFAGPCSKLYKKNAINNMKFDETLKIGEDTIFNLKVFQQIKIVQYIDYCGYNICVNESSLTHNVYGKYSALLELEYHKMWQKKIEKTLIDVGIPRNKVYIHAENNAYIIVYQMLSNLFAHECPYSKKEIKEKIRNILNYNVDKERVFLAKKTNNKKLSKLIKVIYKINSVDFTYFMFRIINIICK